MLWILIALGYVAIGAFITFRVASGIIPSTPGQVAAFVGFALAWPLVAALQIMERTDVA